MMSSNDYNELVDAVEVICDKYCSMTDAAIDQAHLEAICEECPLNKVVQKNYRNDWLKDLKDSDNPYQE